MDRKITLSILLSFVGSIAIVVLLIELSNDWRQNPGSFLREFPPHPALEADAIELNFSDYYIAGGTENTIYLGNYSAPLHMVVVNTSTMDTSHVRLHVKNIHDQKFWSIDVKVDSPHFYLTDGAVPRIYKGSVESWQAERYPFDSVYFLDFEPITSNSFAIRALGRPIRENTLGKIGTSSPHVKMKPGILKKQVDGVFCTDGTMHFNRERNELTYLYLYRNEFTVLDTNLNVLRVGHTIDTTTQANIKVEMIQSTGETKFSTPQRIVNRSSAVRGDLLFVNSMLVARNESPKAVVHATAIDVYQMFDQEYLFSFYIYDYDNKERLKDFLVRGDNLYAMFSRHLQVWNLQPAFFGRKEINKSIYARKSGRKTEHL